MPFKEETSRTMQGGYEVLVCVADRSINKALAKSLKQRLVSGVVAIVTRRTAGNQQGSKGEEGGRHD
jgi:hypothetical protein